MFFAFMYSRSHRLSCYWTGLIAMVCTYISVWYVPVGDYDSNIQTYILVKPNPSHNMIISYLRGIMCGLYVQNEFVIFPRSYHSLPDLAIFMDDYLQ